MKIVNLRRKGKTALFLLLLAVLTVNIVFAQEIIDLDRLGAAEEMKWGVEAYHRGRFNEAARTFEKALAYEPEDAMIQAWLGKAWFRSGYVDAAIHIWESIQTAGGADSVLLNQLEIIKTRTGVESSNVAGGRFLPAMELEGVQEDFTLYKRPASVFPDRNGGFFITAYGTNQVLSFNSNGAVTNRLNGGLEGFNHPFDIKLADNGYLYVTEFNGDRITRCTTDGREIFRFGETGTGPSQLLGPQFIAIDEGGFIYVTDSGNRKVNKYDQDGGFVLSFGRKNYNFEGFLMPTGIACRNGFVYVADAERADISVFDYSGNFISKMADGYLNSPEGLAPMDDSTLLIADKTRVLSLDLNNDVVKLVSDLDGKGRKITQAAIDSNGNLLTADFDLNRITVLTELSNMYSGLYVQIDRINSTAFPQVSVDLRVQDRSGDPFVGLAGNNFVLIENNYPVADVNLVYTGNTDTAVDVVVLIDADISMAEYQPDVVKAVTSVMNSVSGRGRLKLVSAGANPVTEADIREGNTRFLTAASNSGMYVNDGRFDLGLRHAGSELIGERGRKVVIYITDGLANSTAYEEYHPVELSGYLKNNGIRFYPVNVTNEFEMSEELQFISDETGGDQLYLYQPEGLGQLMDDVRRKPDGSYTLIYNSANLRLTPDDYIPVEVEAFLYNRSGREVSGFYKPYEN